jgi:hypothetical protein
MSGIDEFEEPGMAATAEPILTAATTHTGPNRPPQPGLAVPSPADPRRPR